MGVGSGDACECDTVGSCKYADTWVLGVRLRARRRRLVVLWERFRVQWTRGGVWFVGRLQLVGWRFLVPVVGGVMLWLCMGGRWRVCRGCVWLMLVGVWLWRGLEVGSCPGRMVLRARAVMRARRVNKVAQLAASVCRALLLMRICNICWRISSLIAYKASEIGAGTKREDHSNLLI